MAGGGGEGAVYDGVSLSIPNTQDEDVSCCGGGTFYGHESFCDCGHVAFEKERNRKDEAIELVLLCAQDIVDGWPTLTFRTIVNMTKKVDTLKQALDADSLSFANRKLCRKE